MIEATPETLHYWQALKNGRLIADQCARCGRIQPTPRRLCRCGASQMRAIDLPRTGELVSFTTASHAPPDRPWLPSPYTLGVVAFAGLDHRMLALILATEDKLRIGARLAFEPFRSGDMVLPGFVPRKESDD